MLELSIFKTVEVIKENKYFECTFVKKDNTIRTMKCIYNEDKQNSQYLIVYDTENQGYRNVNLSTLLTLTIKNIIYKII